ncbi:DUF2164 domain-containing protein [Halobacillus rhizosphaerae]|uniref:DUF2164 domain-containing protein n=1 Tax=Halobacillus rhizosphaerae TaxID=3064889 RepID=UPI00398B7661
MKSLTKEERGYVMARVQEYFELERDEEIGELAADQLVDYMVKELGPIVYNKAIHDARQMVEQKVMNLDEDLLSLEKMSGRPKRS